MLHQVLYVPALQLPNGEIEDVLVIYTTTNRDNTCSSIRMVTTGNGTLIWLKQLPRSAEWETSTPAIDPTTGIIYLLTKVSDKYYQDCKEFLLTHPGLRK